MALSWRILAGATPVLVAVALATSVPACRRKPPAQPNVVLLAVEGLSVRLGCYGSEAHTPVLDRLAREGRRFEHAYRPYPELAASRTAWITGRRPGAGERGAWRPLPELLRARGYSTWRVGRAFGDADGQAGWEHGQDVASGAAGAAAAAQAAAALVERAAQAGRPFFLMASLPEPEPGWVPPPEHLSRHSAREVRLDAGPELPAGLPRLALADHGQPLPEAARPASEEEQRRTAVAHLALASYLDAQVGAVVEALDRRDLWKSTVLVVVGEAPLRPLPGREPPRPDLLRESALRVPLVVAGPHVRRRGAAAPAPVGLIDVVPTLAAVAGLNAEGLDGLSLLPLLESPRAAAGEGALSSVERRADPLGRSVRTARWRYTRWPDGSRELYDHAGDPGEHHNLAGQPPHAGTEAELAALLAAHAAAANAAPAAPAAAAAPAARGRPRNVLLVAVDDLSTRLGCYGHDVRTPHVDRLAGMGRRFERAYTQYPSCNPSRASFMSGWRPERTGVWSNLTPPREQMPGAVPLQERFRAHGYFTARVGKVYHGPFEHQFAWDVSENTPYPEADEDDPPAPRGRGMASWWRPTDNADAEEPDGRTVRRVARLLERARGRPFFIAAGLHKPHLRWVAPRRYFDLYPPAAVRVPGAPPEDWADVPEIAIARRAPRFAGARIPGRLEPDDLRREAVAAYQACTSFMDAQVGVLLEALDRLSLWRDTVVVFTSDHGFHLGEHGGLWRKNTLFEETLRVPLVIVAPDMAHPGRATPHLAELVDLTPTLLELAGLPPAGGLDGVSLGPLVEDPERPVKEAAFSVAARVPPGLGHTLRTGRWRYTLWPDGSEEMYDHQADPRESRNLAGEPGHAPERHRLRESLVRRLL